MGRIVRFLIFFSIIPQNLKPLIISKWLGLYENMSFSHMPFIEEVNKYEFCFFSTHNFNFLDIQVTNLKVCQFYYSQSSYDHNKITIGKALVRYQHCSPFLGFEGARKPYSFALESVRRTKNTSLLASYPMGSNEGSDSTFSTEFHTIFQDFATFFSCSSIHPYHDQAFSSSFKLSNLTPFLVSPYFF